MFVISEFQARLVEGIVIPKDEVSVSSLVMIGVGQLFHLEPNVEILHEEKAGTINEGDRTLDTADLVRPVVRVQSGSDYQIGLSMFIDDLRKPGRIFTKQHT